MHEFGLTPWPADSQAMQREFWLGRVEAEMIKSVLARGILGWPVVTCLADKGAKKLGSQYE